MPTPWSFEPDLAKACMPPADWYRDPAQLELEQARIFGRTWQLVGRAAEAAEPGSYFTCEVAGEPLVVVRGEDGELRAFSNVCRHRAGPVAVGAGRRARFKCAYHGWTYGLDGRLAHAPEFEGVEGFDAAGCRLPAFRVKTWGQLVFVNLDPEAPRLTEWLGEIPGETEAFAWEAWPHHHTQDYVLDCNWKVYVDNYLEGYHIPAAHPELFRQIDYGRYEVELRRWHSRQLSPLRVQDSVYHRGGQDAPEALYYWLFPNLMLNVYPDNLQTNLILPLGPEKTLTRFEWYAKDPFHPDWDEAFRENLAFSDAVQKEDIFLCESVQQGLRSRSYTSGRYSVRRENGLHHFHGLLAEYLAK